MSRLMKGDVDRGKEKFDKPWQKMNTSTTTKVSDYVESITRNISDKFDGDDLLRVSWLSLTLFFIVGGYWLLRSLKDPIITAIDGVAYIPQAKIVSLFLVFGLVILYNKLLDIYPKHHVFYMMGVFYGILFFIIGLLLLHPTIGLANTKPDPTRLLGWISFCSIESFGSMVVQCYWALVNSSVDVHFAKKHFGVIIAGAQIGSILGPTVATQAVYLGVATLYISGSLIMFLMVGAMYLYIEKFGVVIDDNDNNDDEYDDDDHGVTTTISTMLFNNTDGDAYNKDGSSSSITSCISNTIFQTTPSSSSSATGVGNITKSSRRNNINTHKKEDVRPEEEKGILEGFNLFYQHDYVKGIFAISSFSMVQVTVIDYMMKVLAMERYTSLHPHDPYLALRAFATFMGYFGQVTNTISFLFSFFGTSLIIKHLGFSHTLLAYPALLLLCTVLIWMSPTIWMVFAVMMVIKGMSYALNNPTKEILYQRTSTNIKFKCKSWIDTFGQRSAAAAGSIVTNQFSHSLIDLTNYGSLVGLIMSISLLYISRYMGLEFEHLTERDEKVGEKSLYESIEERQLEMQEKTDREDRTCGVDEEGQNNNIESNNSQSNSMRSSRTNSKVNSRITTPINSPRDQHSSSGNPPTANTIDERSNATEKK